MRPMKIVASIVIIAITLIILSVAIGKIINPSCACVNVPMDNLSDDQIAEITSIALNSPSFPQTPEDTNFTVFEVMKISDHDKGTPILEEYGKNYPVVKVEWKYSNGSEYGVASIFVDPEQGKVIKVDKSFE